MDRLGGVHELRVGGRDPGRAADACRDVPQAVPMRVDLHDGESLRAFCDGCAVVVNCAGPSYQVLDAVARVALEVGAHYVDAAGDLAAIDKMEATPPRELDERVAVFSAGLMPGLSGLLPRLLEPGAGTRLDVYVGGAARIGELSAVDALLTRGPRFGTALAAWRDGRRVPNALRPLRGVALPGFRGRVHAWPFLSVETERLAAELELRELRNYTVYVTESIPRALAAAWAEGGPVERHVPAVVEAAEVDIATTGPYYTMLFQSGRRRLVVQTPDSYALSGVVAAITVDEVLGGRVEPGAGLAAERLDPAAVYARLVADPLVTGADLT
ncbi:saccharopine dehydrogenase-like protein [Thermomonospora umbrina]|uniref:Saccharopine dehydrogenase-like protein n=1 Tax=Thermomonospora umbrina TaxID=111806 RepID=A0A3D9SR09_9ACTN|nr:saccharopine dehydrogenase-like protein [Thermomonospora umbrina]